VLRIEIVGRVIDAEIMGNSGLLDVCVLACPFDSGLLQTVGSGSIGA